MYDNGGDLERAYQKYQLWLSAESVEIDSYRAIVEARLEHLTDILKRRRDGTLPARLPTLTPGANQWPEY